MLLKVNIANLIASYRIGDSPSPYCKRVSAICNSINHNYHQLNDMYSRLLIELSGRQTAVKWNWKLQRLRYLCERCCNVVKWIFNFEHRKSCLRLVKKALLDISKKFVVHSCSVELPKNSVWRLLVDYAFSANGSDFSLQTERLRTIDCNGSRRYDFNDLKAFQQ